MSVSTVAGALERVGVVAVAVLAGTVLLAARSRAPRPHERLRALIMLGALTLTPILLVVDIWDTTQLRSLRHRPALAVGALIGALIVVAAGKLLVRRRPEL
ncbi:MAG TPA: hypothetical protein VGN69_08860, partial [Solirubrobacteraceae bacterium]|nr:hypothetical protein [Solirubrobacteraceae bacterium]